MRKHAAILCFALASCPALTAQNYNNDGDTLFGSANIHSIYFNFYHPDYYDSLVTSYTTDSYYVCDMIFDGVPYDSVGIKFKGNSSYNNPGQKKSMKIDLDLYVAGQDIDDLNKFNLNNGFKDPTFMREKIMSDFMVRNGIPAPRVTYAKVYYNNQYWGLFTLSEEVNKDFLDAWFNDQRGNLFKGDPSGDLKWINSTPSSYYNKYELKTNETINDWSDLVQFIKVANLTPVNDLRDSVDMYFNTSAFLKAWAASNIFANLDSYIGTGHNYYIYHDSITNRFQWIMYDVNEAFGVFTQGMNITQLENLSPFYLGSPTTNRPLCNNLLLDNATKQELTYWFCVLMQMDQFSNAALDPVIDSLANKIRNDYYADPNKFYTNQQFEDNQSMNVNVVGPGGGNFPGLKSFIANRRNSLTASLAPYGCYLTVDEGNETELILVFPNPASEQLSISATGQDKEVVISLINVLGQTVYSQTFGSGTEIRIDVSSLSAGIYTLSYN
ncbi:MAG: CotH kinase family protein, partial [Bacteroidota bacterium]